MRAKSITYPSKAFWTKYRRQVLVDSTGMVTLTVFGMATLGRAMTALGMPVTKPWRIADFEVLAEHAIPYMQELTADHDLLQKFPPNAPEREMLAMLLGVSESSQAAPSSPPAAVVDINKWRASRAA